MLRMVEARLRVLSKPILFLPLGFWFVIFAFIALAAMGFYAPRGDDGNLIAPIRAGVEFSPDWSPIYIALMRLTLNGRPDSTLIYLQFAIYVTQIFLLSTFMSKRIREPVSAIGIILFILSPASALMTLLVTEQSSYAVFLAQNFFIAAILIILNKQFLLKRYFRFGAMACFVMASLSRPEFLWSVGAFLIYSQYLNLKSRDGIIMSVTDVTLFCLILLVFYSYFGVPIAGSERALMAFGQHYALRQCEAFSAFPLCYNPWGNYQEILRLGLGEHHSVVEYIRANSSAFFFHALSNGLRLVLFLATFGYGAPNLRKVPMLYLPAMMTSLLLGIVIGRDILLRIMKGIRITSFDVFLFGCSIPFLISSISFYPRAHYISTPILIMILIVYRRRDQSAQTVG